MAALQGCMGVIGPQTIVFFLRFSLKIMTNVLQLDQILQFQHKNSYNIKFLHALLSLFCPPPKIFSCPLPPPPQKKWCWCNHCSYLNRCSSNPWACQRTAELLDSNRCCLIKRDRTSAPVSRLIWLMRDWHMASSCFWASSEDSGNDIRNRLFLPPMSTLDKKYWHFYYFQLPFRAWHNVQFEPWYKHTNN